MNKKVINIVIADDHEMIRRGLRMTILGETDMQLVGEATNGVEAVALVQTHQPQVVLLDVQMPEMDGIAAAKIIKESCPETHILMLTSFGDDAHLFAAMQIGVTGYLLKDTSGDDLVAAIRGAAAGTPQLHPEVARRLMNQMSQPKTPLDELTDRERDVLKLMALGQSNKEIGVGLGLTAVTIKGYVSSILSKLQVADRTQAALVAARFGVINLDDLPWLDS